MRKWVVHIKWCFILFNKLYTKWYRPNIIAELAQLFGKLAQQILWKCVKIRHFLLLIEPIFSPEAIILAQDLPPISWNFVELA